jgi:hypothetical protein
MSLSHKSSGWNQEYCSMTTHLSRLLVLTAMTLSLAGAAFAADADGTWAGFLATPDGDIAQVFKLKTAGAVLTGTVTSPEGNDIAIAEGKVEGNHLSFTVTLDYKDKPRSLTYFGVVSKEEIAFEVVLAGDRPRTFKEIVKRRS